MTSAARILKHASCWLLVFAASVSAQEDSQNYAKALSKAFRQAANRATPSVVTLISKAQTLSDDQLRELRRDPRFREFFPNGIPDGEDLPPIPGINSQVGSGVIIDSKGVILTNNHVVQNAKKITIRFSNGEEQTARDVETDPKSDLAVVRFTPQQPVAAARLGNSDLLEIGDWVIAIGSPFELEATVSAGIISGKGRGIEKIERGRLLQTDAAINPGNSGGPLVNLDGEVIGINTAIATTNNGYQGIGFAIPANRAKWVARELLAHGKVRRAYLGIRIDELQPSTARKLNLPARSGVFVASVASDSPADTAGLQVNDVIVEFAGKRVRTPRDLQDEVEQKPIGSKQQFKIMREGRALTLSVTLSPLP